MELGSLKNISQAHLTTSDKDRFLKKVIIPDDHALCWEWIAWKNKKGYGAIGFRDLGNIPAHRFSYLLHKGDFDQTKIVCHTCDNTSCVNPSHLFVGTHSDNMKDKIKKGRAKNPPPHLGINHHKSKVNPKTVKEIRALFEKGVSQTELASIYSLHTSSMHNICRKKTWKDVK